MISKTNHTKRRSTRSACSDGRVSSASSVSRASKINSHTWKFGYLATLAVVLTIMGPTSALPIDVEAANFFYGPDSGGFKYADPNDSHSQPIVTNPLALANPWLVFREGQCMNDPACDNYCNTHDCGHVRRVGDDAPSTGRALLNVVTG